jgi:hypothetical protein
MLSMLLCSLCSVVSSVVQMTLGGVGVVGRRLVVASFVMLGRLTVMASCMFVMFGRLLMMFCRLFGHVSSSEIGQIGPGWQRVDCARVG